VYWQLTLMVGRLMPRRRNYKTEYSRRITKGLTAGKSRSSARGHARAVDLPKPEPRRIDRDDPRERALKLMRGGASQARAARTTGVSAEQLRRYRLQQTSSQRERGRWIIFDSRPQPFRVISSGKVQSVVLPNDEGSEIARYWNVVDKFLATNDADHLDPYIGEGVYDVNGRLWILETRPNVLRRLDSIGELNFIEIYSDVAP
jgi:hypothetical protein